MKHEMKYKVGDKVRIVSQWGPGCRQNLGGRMDKWLGKVMTIREICHDVYHMEEDKDEHRSCSCLGWAWFPAAIAGLACEQKIVVTTDGKVTTARLFDGKQLVKATTAECSDAETFDFAIGAALAVDRLLGSEKKAEPETVFPKEKLVPGVFGHTSDGDWFVVVGDHLVYVNGQYDKLAEVGSAGEYSTYCIDCIVEAKSFSNAKARAHAGNILWSRPGAKFA